MKNFMFRIPLSSGAVVMFFSIALISGFLMTACTPRGNPEQANPLAETVEKVRPSVVSIVIRKNSTGFGNTVNIQRVGSGSGFIISADGLVVTSKHVVGDVDANYRVILYDESEYNVDDIVRHPDRDVAVLRLSSREGGWPMGLPFLTLGNSDEVQIGQGVVAFGNGVTEGSITAKSLDIPADGIKGTQELSNLLQTDTYILPGDSGGPLVNQAGEVIGINTAFATDTAGVGFAIAINDVKAMIEASR